MTEELEDVRKIFHVEVPKDWTSERIQEELESIKRDLRKVEQEDSTL